MNSSDAVDTPGVILSEIVQLLSGERQNRLIDTPLDEAAEKFVFNSDEPLSHRLFSVIAARFVRHVYRSGLRFRLELTEAQSHSEAVALLGSYDGAYGRGYEAAYLEAKECGLKLILVSLQELIRTREKEKYFHWVLSHKFESVNWFTRCRITEILLQRCQSLDNTEITRCTAAQLTDDFPEILSIYLDSERFVSDFFSTHF